MSTLHTRPELTPEQIQSIWYEDWIWFHPAHPGFEVLRAIFFPRATASFRNPSERLKGEGGEKAHLEGLSCAVEGKKEICRKIQKLRPWGNQFNLKAEEVIQSIKRIGNCHRKKVQSKFISLGSPIFLMSRRCELTDTPDTPLLVFKRGSMPRLNMLTLYCDSDNCDFQTPPLNREHYQAIVAHLQVN